MRRDNSTKYRIRIKNWDQHQLPLKGKGERRRRREWVAISVDLFSDPDFLSLDATHSRLWLGLLLHAGKVGPEFELSPSYARLLFDLRRSCDFQVLADQGFIDLETTTNKTNKTDKTYTVQPAKPARVKRTAERFDEFWSLYPKKVGKKPARQKWLARNLDQIADKIITDVQARIDGDDQWRRGYVPNPVTYINQDRWEDPLPVRRSSRMDTSDLEGWLKRSEERENRNEQAAIFDDNGGRARRLPEGPA